MTDSKETYQVVKCLADLSWCCYYGYWQGKGDSAATGAQSAVPMKTPIILTKPAADRVKLTHSLI